MADRLLHVSALSQSLHSSHSLSVSVSVSRLYLSFWVKGLVCRVLVGVGVQSNLRVSTKPTEIIGNRWFSVGFYSVFDFWAFGFLKKKICLGFFYKCSIQAHSFSAIFGPFLETCFSPLWAFIRNQFGAC